MEEKICKLYEIGNSISDISKNMSLSKSKVYRILKKHNIDTKKNSSNYIEKLCKYKIDNTFFEKVDTEEKAYILGFLYADGNLSKKYYHIKLKLQERDKPILEEINKIIGSDKPLYFHKREKEEHQNQYSILISNKKMYYDLIKLGLYPNKTYSLSFKNVFEDTLFCHFLRGYFDGDGCICEYMGKQKSTLKDKTIKIYLQRKFEISFVGSVQIIEFLSNYLNENLDIRCKLRRNRKNCSKSIIELKITSKKDVRKFYNFIYKNATIFLTRKKNKFNNLKNK